MTVLRWRWLSLRRRRRLKWRLTVLRWRWLSLSKPSPAQSGSAVDRPALAMAEPVEAIANPTWQH
ncbi:MAG: hypothetical protein NZ699_05925 [Roseiflexus sp.]|nr:hypothetical protein [Roseiflexus sp.]MDW8148098.1 hypothetical protein [Roseiflexaceae bacterium]